MKWEYSAVSVFEERGNWEIIKKGATPKLEDVLNSTQKILETYGQEGWELVSNTFMAQNLGHFGNMILIFKRPLEE